MESGLGTGARGGGVFFAIQPSYSARAFALSNDLESIPDVQCAGHTQFHQPY
jgi:hypothetical protein